MSFILINVGAAAGLVAVYRYSKGKKQWTSILAAICVLCSWAGWALHS